MMRFFLFVAVAAGLTLSAQARPILSDSQKSYAAVCLEDAEPAARLAAICETAIADAGIGASDLREIRVVLALAYHNLGKADQARRLLEDVLDEDPAHTAALNGLGWVHWGTDDYDLAKAAFQRSLDTGATAQGFAGLASSGRLEGTLAETDYLRLMDAAIAMSPGYTWAMRDKAWYFIDAGRPSEAEPVLRTALFEDEDDPWTLSAMGAAMSAQNKYAAALKWLNQAVETGHAPTSAYLYRARVNYWVENYRRALIDAERVAQDWPGSSDGPVWKARSLAALGLRPAGISVLQDFLEGGHNSFANYWLADLLYNGDEVDAAITALTRNTNDDGADYYDHEMMAMMLLEQEQYTDARGHISAALELEPDASYPVYYASLIEVAEGDYDTAETLFLDALADGLPRRHIRSFIGAMTDTGALDRAIAFRHKANQVSADN